MNNSDSKPDRVINMSSANVIVSVIIVSWNARDYLVKCLSSLKSTASRRSTEIIVVDNDSTDGSAECVATQFPEVQLIRNSSNLGFAKANNIGYARCSGKYVALINSDVVVLEGCLDRLVDYCEGNGDVGMVGPRVIGGDGNLQRSCRGFPTLWNMLCSAFALDKAFPRSRIFNGYSLSFWPQETGCQVDILSGCFWLVRRDALKKVGLLDEAFFMYGEDMDWCKRFWSAGWKLFFFPEAEAIHYGGASSSNAPVRFYVERQKADLQYWRKHHSHIEVLCFFLICCLRQLTRAIGYLLILPFSGQRREKHLQKFQRSLSCLKWLLFQRSNVPA